MRRPGIAGVLAAAALAALAATGSAATTTTWRFAVDLDGKPIGTHHFALRGPAGERELVSEARFRVTVLGIPVYHYAHDATERWDDGCLASLQARTDDNGARSEVSAAARAPSGLAVRRPSGAVALDGCVMTFAYWDPRILGQRRLLNAQTGIYEEVRVDRLEAGSVTVRGGDVPAVRYRITAAAKTIDVWYSTDAQWLALDTTVDGGRHLRYRQP